MTNITVFVFVAKTKIADSDFTQVDFLQFQSLSVLIFPSNGPLSEVYVNLLFQWQLIASHMMIVFVSTLPSYRQSSKWPEQEEWKISPVWNISKQKKIGWDTA